MNKIIKNTICSNSKIKKSIFIIQYRISQRINQIFEILGLYCFAFTALTINKTFTQRNFLPSKIKILSIYFQKNLRTRLRPKIPENLRTANFNKNFLIIKKE